FWVRCEGFHQIEVPVFGFPCIVGMNAETRLNPVIGLGNGNPAAHIIRTGSCPDRHNVAHSGIPGALNHVGPVFGVADIVKMRVMSDEHYFPRPPLVFPCGKPASIGGSPSPSDAATIIPLDSMPRNFRGCKLATTTTFRPISFSG